MKKIFIFVFSIVSFEVHAQLNLVPNPSFEQYSSCPSGLAQAYKATSWGSYNTPEYFNVCATSSDAQVPENYMGFQYAATGNAYCGFITYSAPADYHEFLIVQLLTPLVINQKYFVSFKLSAADSTFCVYSNKTGIKFFVTAPTSLSLNNSAHFYTNAIITDTLNWTKVAGSFVADSAYKYAIIGNFFKDANTNIIDNNCGYPLSYYYIDDVCVSTDSLSCNIVTPVNLLAFEAKPNKKSVQLFWNTAQESNNKGFEILRSKDNTTSFEKIGFVPGVGFSSVEQKYYFTDGNLEAETDYYYKLRQIDFDDRFFYSPIRKAKVFYENNSIFSVSPNPVLNTARVHFLKPMTDNYQLKILDNSGKVFIQQTFVGAYSNNSVNINMENFLAGLYFIQITNNSKTQTEKIIKE